MNDSYITWSDMIQLSLAIAAWVSVFLMIYYNKKK